MTISRFFKNLREVESIQNDIEYFGARRREAREKDPYNLYTYYRAELKHAHEKFKKHPFVIALSKPINTPEEDFPGDEADTDTRSSTIRLRKKSG